MKLNKRELLNHLLQTTIDLEDYEMCSKLRDYMHGIKEDEYYEIDEEYNYCFKIDDEGLSIYKTSLNQPGSIEI